jgi:hypothetical protein
VELVAGGPTQVPFQEAVYEITGRTPCATLTDVWQDIAPAFRTGSWVATLHDRGAVRVEVAVASSSDVGAKASVLVGSGTADAGRVSPQPLGASSIVTAQLTRTGDYRPVFRFALDRIPDSVKARIVEGADKSLTVCSHEPLVPLFTSGDRALLRSDFEAEPYFGAGWGDVERTSAGRRRRGETGAALFLPLNQSYAYRAVFELDAERPTKLSVVVNGIPGGACAVAGSTRCEIEIPQKSVREGINTIAFGAPSAGPSFSLHRVELSRHRIGL